MNATQQMEAVNTIVLTLLEAFSAAVTLGTSWMKMDWTVVVRNDRSAWCGTCMVAAIQEPYL